MAERRFVMRATRAILGTLVVALAASCAHPRTAVGGPGAPRAPRTIRVLVYNLHAGKDAHGVESLAGVAALVRQLDADVALFQEVDAGTRRSAGHDQPAELAGGTGYHVAFGASLEHFDGGRYGIAILSRWPIVGDSVVHLVVDPPQERAGGSHEPRVALRVVIATPFGRAVVVNTHLDPTGNDHWRRQEAAEVLRTALDARRDAAIVVAGGDFNSTPESEVQQSLRDGGLADAWAGCGTGTGLTYPADSAVKRIDYLFVAAGLRCRTARVVETELSDHRPVLFDLTAQ